MAVVRWMFGCLVAAAVVFLALDQWLHYRLGNVLEEVRADRAFNWEEGDLVDWRLRIEDLLPDVCLALTGAPAIELLPASGGLKLPEGMRVVPDGGRCQPFRRNAVVFTDRT